MAYTCNIENCTKQFQHRQSLHKHINIFHNNMKRSSSAASASAASAAPPPTAKVVSIAESSTTEPLFEIARANATATDAEFAAAISSALKMSGLKIDRDFFEGLLDLIRQKKTLRNPQKKMPKMLTVSLKKLEWTKGENHLHPMNWSCLRVSRQM